VAAPSSAAMPSSEAAVMSPASARRLHHYPGRAKETAHRVKAAGAAADGCQGLDIWLLSAAAGSCAGAEA